MIKKILIIEDDMDMCNELNEALTDLGYQVHLAFDGLAGKKIIEKNKYDIIVLDLKIPKFDGYRILDFMSKKLIKSKVIVITARMKIHYEDIIRQNQEQEENDLLKKADSILIKPFKIMELINEINTC
ncbi:MAG: response regulator [Spirochaetales bacterium]|nr:response regulator [Spirochaetales bacterium]